MRQPRIVRPFQARLAIVVALSATAVGCGAASQPSPPAVVPAATSADSSRLAQLEEEVAELTTQVESLDRSLNEALALQAACVVATRFEGLFIDLATASPDELRDQAGQLSADFAALPPISWRSQPTATSLSAEQALSRMEQALTVIDRAPEEAFTRPDLMGEAGGLATLFTWQCRGS